MSTIQIKEAHTTAANLEKIMTKQFAIETIKKYLTVGEYCGEQAVLFNQKKAFEDGAIKPYLAAEPDIIVGEGFEIVDGKYEVASTGDQFQTIDELVNFVADYLAGRCKKEILS